MFWSKHIRLFRWIAFIQIFTLQLQAIKENDEDYVDEPGRGYFYDGDYDNMAVPWSDILQRKVGWSSVDKWPSQGLQSDSSEKEKVKKT